MYESSVSFSHPWPEKPFGDIGNVTVGGTPSTAVSKYWGGNVPWMASGDVHLKVVTEVPTRISHLGLKNSNATLVEPPSVAVALAGQGKTRGTAALVLSELCTNQSVALLKGDPETLDTEYLLHNLAFRYEELRSRSAGGGRAGLSKQLIEQVPIPLPPLPEQAKIAEVLSTVDRAIEQTEALIAKQQCIKTGLMQDLLTRGIDEYGNLRSEQTHDFKDSPLGRIPVEWEIKTLSELAEVDRGKFTHRPRNDPRFYGGEFPFIQTGDITSRIGRKVASYTQTLNKRGTKVSKQFGAGTIAITIAANIADTAILEIPMFFPDSVVGAIVSPPNSNRFVELMIRRWKPILEGLAPQSAQKNINLETLRPLIIPTPSPDEQKRIGDMYDNLDSNQEQMERCVQKLRSLKTALMQDLLTGKKRVTELLNAERETSV